jgi:hypothetical protein
MPNYAARAIERTPTLTPAFSRDVRFQFEDEDAAGLEVDSQAAVRCSFVKWKWRVVLP